MSNNMFTFSQLFYKYLFTVCFESVFEEGLPLQLVEVPLKALFIYRIYLTFFSSCHLFIEEKKCVKYSSCTLDFFIVLYGAFIFLLFNVYLLYFLKIENFSNDLIRIKSRVIFWISVRRHILSDCLSLWCWYWTVSLGVTNLIHPLYSSPSAFHLVILAGIDPNCFFRGLYCLLCGLEGSQK